VSDIGLAYRVLDLTDGEGMFCGKVLADLGADVVVLEPPDGHPARVRPPILDGEDSLQWWSYATGKSSAVVDVSSPAGREEFRALVEASHALLVSDPAAQPVPPDLEALVHAWNPGLVVTRLTPFGSWGPYRHYAGSDLVLQALGGYLRLNGDPDRAPVRISHELAPLLAAAYGAFSTIVALRAGGERPFVDVSAQDAAGWQLLNAPATPVLEHKDPERSGIYSQAMAQIQGIPFPLIYECKNGYVLFFVVGGPGGARSFYELRDWMKEDGAAPDVFDEMVWEEIDFLRNPGAKDLHETTVKAWTAFLETKTKEEIFSRALDRGILIAPVNDMADVAGHEQLHARGFFRDVDGRRTVPGGFVVVNGQRLEANSAPPERGQRHQRSVAPAAVQHAGRGDQPYAGLKVLDLGWMYAGPAAPRIFAELGANVVRVESETRVDLTRTSGPFKDDRPGLNRAQLFMEANAGKRSVGLNLNESRGVEVMRRLALEWADVVVAGFPPGPLEAWELTYDDVKDSRPDLIVARTCQMGQTGPHRNYRGFGYNSASIAGFLSLTGWPDRPPTLFHGAYSDILTPPIFALALAVAIDRRERTGAGGTVDLSQFEVSAYYLREPLTAYLATGALASRLGNRATRFAPQGVYPCSGEDQWIAISCTDDEQWAALCAAAGLDDLAGDAALHDAAGRQQRHDEIDERLSAWSRGREPAELMHDLQANGVPAGALWRLGEWIEDPQLAARGYFRWLHHPVMDYVPYLGPPAVSSAYSQLVRRGPLLGEHSAEVLAETLGLGDDDLADLVADGVIQVMLD